MTRRRPTKKPSQDHLTEVDTLKAIMGEHQREDEPDYQDAVNEARRIFLEAADNLRAVKASIRRVCHLLPGPTFKPLVKAMIDGNVRPSEKMNLMWVAVKFEESYLKNQIALLERTAGDTKESLTLEWEERQRLQEEGFANGFGRGDSFQADLLEVLRRQEARCSMN